ncbi:MAG: hypothetical protein IT165_32610 [Bryobacterales bacterium]|nr:hypothetical protein [Bryobacterales bacterium]
MHILRPIITYRICYLLAGTILTHSNVMAQPGSVLRIEVREGDPNPQAKRSESPTRAILERLHSLALRSAQSQWERDHVTGGEKSMRQTLAVTPDALIGMVTISDPTGDVFAAKWTPSAAATGLGIDGMAIWDVPEYNYIILTCAERVFDSASTVETFLRRILEWKRVLPVLQSVKVWHGQLPYGMVLVGSGFLAPGFEFGGRFEIGAWLRGHEVDLVLKIDKACFGGLYPEGSSYVPERFPPLKDRISAWPRDRILQEIGKTWQAAGPMQAYPNRDKILMREALRRGLTSRELETILVAASPRQDFLGLRVDAVMKMVVELNQVPRYHEAIASAISARDRIDPYTIRSLFVMLAGVQQDDFSNEALECVAHCTFPDAPGFPMGAFYYLGERATAETARKLSETVVPERLQKMKGATLLRIGLRLKEEKQK